MKKKKWTALLLAVCLVVTTMTTVPLAGAAEHTATTETFLSVLKNANDGDIIDLNGGSCHVNDIGKNMPLIISKSVTIQNGGLGLWRAGIILDADVTFKDVTISHDGFTQNAILANGHTLTLENVTCASGARPLNLFCGGYVSDNKEGFPTKDDIPAPGTTGKIIIRGNTDLRGAGDAGTCNVYAGNLCLGGMTPETSTQNGPTNAFKGNAIIQIEENATANIGEIYACGAQQKNPEQNPDEPDKVIAGKITRPDAKNYTVAGTVDITINKGFNVHGAGASTTNVTYAGTVGENPATPILENVTGLTAKSGNLLPAADSSFQNLSINDGAILSLASLGTSLAVTDFTGGGSLVLGQSQILTISGQVSGTTDVGIGGISGGFSTNEPISSKVYIQAPNSTADAFRLLPQSETSTAYFSFQDGKWTAADRSALAASFSFEEGEPNPIAIIGNGAKELPLIVTDANEREFTLDFIPLTIQVNNMEASSQPDEVNEGYFIYTSAQKELTMEITDNTLCVTPMRSGIYTITVVIPEEYTATGNALSDSIVLIVNDSATTPDENLKTVPIPTPASGQKWTGKPLQGVPEGEGYTRSGTITTEITGTFSTTLTLKEGYQWPDGSTEPITLVWVVALGDPRPEPTGLVGVAPTSANGTGKITGTTADMRYSTTKNLQDSTPCSADETTGLTPGDYYVFNYNENCVNGNAVKITVPAYEEGGDEGDNNSPGGDGDNTGGDDGDKPGGGDDGDNKPGTGDGDNKPGTGDGDNKPGTGDGDNKPSTGDGDNTKPGGNTGSTTRPNRPGSSTNKPSTPSTDTTTKPDGTIVSTTTDKISGTVTEVTKKPDGSQTTVETRKDGTVVTTQEAVNGNTTKTIQYKDGSKDVSLRQSNGLTADVSTDPYGRISAEVRIPTQLSGNGQSVSLPIPAVYAVDPSQSADVVTLYTGRSQPVKVNIPAQNLTDGTVAVLVRADGSETLLKQSVVENGTMALSVPDGASVKLINNGKSFADTNRHWAQSAISFTSARELFSGTAPNSFSPEGTMSREMLMTVLARFDGVDTNGGSTWSEKGMAWAMANGISDGSNPQGFITREQLVTMLYRYANSPAVSNTNLTFQDADQVSPYARNAVAWAVENGILNGFSDGTLLPGGDTTRAQAATLFMQYAQYLNR